MTGRVIGSNDLPGVHVVCERSLGRQVIGQHLHGCAYWQREPGSDDQ